jgi:hypothetical protein
MCHSDARQTRQAGCYTTAAGLGIMLTSCCLWLGWGDDSESNHLDSAPGRVTVWRRLALLFVSTTCLGAQQTGPNPLPPETRPWRCSEARCFRERWSGIDCEFPLLMQGSGTERQRAKGAPWLLLLSLSKQLAHIHLKTPVACIALSVVGLATTWQSSTSRRRHRAE